MMNRRTFLKGLILGVVAAVVAPSILLPAEKPVEVKQESPIVGYKGYQYFEAGYVYAPYIPLTVTAVLIDNEVRCVPYGRMFR